MFALGYSINVLTLLAAVLAIGLVFGDAVVVLENAARRIKEFSEPPLLAAARGTKDLGLALAANTAVTVAVFVPISFLGGKVGRLFSEFGVLLAASATGRARSPTATPWPSGGRCGTTGSSPARCC